MFEIIQVIFLILKGDFNATSYEREIFTYDILLFTDLQSKLYTYARKD